MPTGLTSEIFRWQEARLAELGVARTDLDAVRRWYAIPVDKKIEASREVIQRSIIDVTDEPDARFALAIAESESLLKNYATLDDDHRSDITKLITRITSYLRDATRKRPFNALMLASPGAGKSHFIKKLAQRMKDDRVEAVTFNMATMQSPDDMAQPIDELRNLKVNDRFPLLFLDEFDSEPVRYGSLLPLLWEGELHIGHRNLQLGKAVVVLAGSNPDLPKAMERSATMGLDFEKGEYSPAGKLVDLLSRINGGVIKIPDLDLRTKERDRRVDKICITVSLLKQRFGEELTLVPRSLLRLVAHTAFRYGSRSIAHLIDMIDSEALKKGGVIDGDALRLPLMTEAELGNSSLSLHVLDKDKAFGIVNRWKDFSQDHVMVSVMPPSLPDVVSRLLV